MVLLLLLVVAVLVVAMTLKIDLVIMSVAVVPQVVKVMVIVLNVTLIAHPCFLRGLMQSTMTLQAALKASQTLLLVLGLLQ